eukprot:TRINITY_DN7850_c0_g1_i3.p1 TRINITY_DN7850_c0_g1~~TRINITY_DN7850_c0_g1_i3.p1  ORF type:complete len:827 (+),score=318.13 TRINITY_DN7850_c0_g1_i3:228-2483(+)
MTGRSVFYNIRRRPAPVQPSEVEENKPTKLAIGVPGGLDISAQQYVYDNRVVCLACQTDLNAPELAGLTAEIDAADSVSKAQAVAQWENKLETCEHALCLEQDPSAPQLAMKSLAKCQSCDIAENLWLCLTCGALGCARRNYDGSGGNGHGEAHFLATGHPLVCRMGTITPEGTADIHCYSCDELRLDENLSAHLAHFGIRVADQTKTAKSLAEMDLELNLNHDWSAAYEQGKETNLVFGPGCTGLVNLGNSCYMASVIQTVFPLPSFRQRYFEEGARHLAECRSDRPAECYQCQMAKLAHGLLSGTYSTKPEGFDAWKAQRDAERAARQAAAEAQDNKEEEKKARDQQDQQLKDWQPGIPPRMFKALVTQNHGEFRSNRQQDALEFFQFFLQEVQRKERANGVDPTAAFQFKVENRLQCTSCNCVRYTEIKTSDISLPIPVDESLFSQKGPDGKNVKVEFPPVPFDECLARFAAPSVLEGYNCPVCARRTTANTTVRFKTFPDTLLVHMKRFICPSWVPVKLDVQVDVSDRVSLEGLRGAGLQPHEQPMPEQGGGAAAPAGPVADDALVQQLMGMGFSQNACTRAALAVNNVGLEDAANWLFSHMEDADLNDPLPAAGAAAAPAAPEHDPMAIASLCSMGFDEERAKYALTETGGDVDRALDWLFSHADDPLPAAAPAPAAAMEVEDVRPPVYELYACITHLGTSTGCGHYVAHVRQPDGSWVYFNDTKVSQSVDLPKGQAYLYIFRKAN